MQNRKPFRHAAAFLVVLAALATASTAFGQSTTLEAAQGSDFFGTYSMTLTTPDGDSPITFSLLEVEGNVAMRFGGVEEPTVTDFTRAGAQLTAYYEISYQGVNLPVSITFERDGENLKTAWIFADGAFTSGGLATKQP